MPGLQGTPVRDDGALIRPDVARSPGGVDLIARATALATALALVAVAAVPATVEAEPSIRPAHTPVREAAGPVSGTAYHGDLVRCDVEGAAQLTLAHDEDDTWRAQLTLTSPCLALADDCSGPLDDMDCELGGSLTVTPVSSDVALDQARAFEVVLEDPLGAGEVAGTLTGAHVAANPGGTP